mmetsp:Transcript_14670/g.20583  ORF Transcript_14670/g.20583 Transcript_14670/m.20583 type:complete len:176 (+) Transcript_14670:72-599(+)
MKLQLLVLALFLGVALGQLVLTNPSGRGFDSGDSTHAPCGQSPSAVGAQVAWEHDTNQEIEIQIIGAGGGGVIEDRWSCALNGAPTNNVEPLYPIEGAMKVALPNRDFQIYRLYVRTPSIRCTGDATMQLIYSTQNGQEYFQCQDVLITNSNSASTLLSGAAIAISAIAALLVVV